MQLLGTNREHPVGQQLPARNLEAPTGMEVLPAEAVTACMEAPSYGEISGLVPVDLLV